MTFKTVKGDITIAFDNEEVDYITHCVNCQGVWGAGLAKTLKGKYFIAYQDYISHVNSYGKKNVLGDTIRTVIPGGQGIFSCFGLRVWHVF